MAEEAGFWGHYFAPYLHKVRSREALTTPVMISNYLKTHQPHNYVEVSTGAWNVGSTSGQDQKRSERRWKKDGTSVPITIN
jgi:ribosomal protein S19